MITHEFRKRWDDDHGFNYEEALRKANAVNEAHGVGKPKSCWNPAQIVIDQLKKDGFKVIITSK